MSKTRRRFTAEQKADVVQRHLTGEEAVSDLADRLGLQPTLIHTWDMQVLDQADRAFERSTGGRRQKYAQREEIARHEARLLTKNEVIVELMEENVRAKKANGEP